MTSVSLQTLESLISLSANGDNFYALISTLQSLYAFLRNNSSARCEDDYLRLMAHLMDNYLNAQKKMLVRKQLSEMIVRKTQDEYSANYFKQRLLTAEIFDLLKHHHNLTGKWLVITNVDYDQQKFKVKQV